MNYIDYRKQLGISWNNKDNIRAFTTKILNIFERLVSQSRGSYYDNVFLITVDEYLSFCNKCSIDFSNRYNGVYAYAVIDSLELTKKNFEEFLVRCVALINSFSNSDKAENFKRMVILALEESHIPVDVIKDDDGYFIFPKGAKELDDALVSETLLWVSEYPRTYKKYCEALRRYAAGDSENPSVIADDFRKVLETFFQEFFEQKKSLEHMIGTYGDYMKEKGVPAELSNEFEKLLKCYTSFNNSYAKHHDGTTEKVLEHIMYQTGSIIRFVISLGDE